MRVIIWVRLVKTTTIAMCQAGAAQSTSASQE